MQRNSRLLCLKVHIQNGRKFVSRSIIGRNVLIVSGELMTTFKANITSCYEWTQTVQGMVELDESAINRNSFVSIISKMRISSVHQMLNGGEKTVVLCVTDILVVRLVVGPIAIIGDRMMSYTANTRPIL